uniref:DUF397 domain-containing protein n=1 Tax=Oryza sativa subsp. japonica TaxID=39947 RepID=Q6Z5T8_ORYSJ|nr:hypothetical protein [Oryza sativa Japonica Group]
MAPPSPIGDRDNRPGEPATRWCSRSRGSQENQCVTTVQDGEDGGRRSGAGRRRRWTSARPPEPPLVVPVPAAERGAAATAG